MVKTSECKDKASEIWLLNPKKKGIVHY